MKTVQHLLQRSKPKSLKKTFFQNQTFNKGEHRFTAFKTVSRNQFSAEKMQTGLWTHYTLYSTWRGEGRGASLSLIRSEVSEPMDSLSLSSPPRVLRRLARGLAGGATRRDTHTMLWICSQIRRNRRMLPVVQHTKSIETSRQSCFYFYFPNKVSTLNVRIKAEPVTDAANTTVYVGHKKIHANNVATMHSKLNRLGLYEDISF